jgi:hypothetical protein
MTRTCGALVLNLVLRAQLPRSLAASRFRTVLHQISGLDVMMRYSTQASRIDYFNEPTPVCEPFKLVAGFPLASEAGL